MLDCLLCREDIGQTFPGLRSFVYFWLNFVRLFVCCLMCLIVLFCRVMIVMSILYVDL